MDVSFKTGFLRDIKKVKDKKLLKKVEDAIEEIEMAENIKDIRNLKKLEGYEEYYRLRVGEYRIGLIMVKGHIYLIRFLHRKDLYRKFP